MDSGLTYNRELRSLLADLAELNPKLDPGELVALWFDTLYFPGQSYVGVKGQNEWRSCFNQAELAAMAKFHSEFDAVVDQLPKSQDWRSNPLWRKVSAAASAALHEMGVHA